MYRCKHFSIYELVYPEVYHSRGDRCWELLDERALRMLDALRNRFGEIIVNDYQFGGNYKESGLRSFTTSTGAALSQHRFGRAFDCKPKETPLHDMYSYVSTHPSDFPLITTLENIDATASWMHFDVRNTDISDGIRIVNP